jgi:2-amino-4-hydroxy-6-hydroxymethyldihydropteridine diphosphokinase
MPKRRYYLSIGSNLGDRNANLKGIIDRLASSGSVEVVDASSFRETDPVGVDVKYADMKFLNAAVCIETDLDPYGLLDLTQGIEKSLGRIRPAPVNSPRTADIDIIASNDGIAVFDPPRLVIPHPRAAEREFVMQPLREIAPEIAEAIANDR